MQYKTHYKFLESKNNETKSAILTTGFLGNIDSSKSLQHIATYLHNKNYNIVMFDMYAHGGSEGNIENFTLSQVYRQILQMIQILEQKGKQVEILYGSSISSLPMLKVGLEKKIQYLILKSPVIEIYAKRNRELGEKKMRQRHDLGKIKLLDDYRTGNPIYITYNFIDDVLMHFHALNLGSQHTKIFLGSGKNDPEIPYFELQALKKRYKNIRLRFYNNEGHKLSVNALEKFIKDVDLFLHDQN